MNLCIIVLFSIFIVSCGVVQQTTTDPDNRTGTNATVTVDASNADRLAVAATGATRQAIDAKNMPLFGVSSANKTANRLVPGVCSSGSIDISFNPDSTVQTIIYDNCTIDNGYFTFDESSDLTADGKFIFTTFPDGSSSFRYIDFIMTYLEESHKMNVTMTCDPLFNCSYLSDYTGPDGRNYHVEGSNVTETGISSYIVSGFVSDPDYGTILINSDVTYGSCPGYVPESGTITYNGAGDSFGSVVFNSCDSFTVTVDSVATTYSWSDYLD